MKVRNFAIYTFVFVIVLASFKLPELLLNLKYNDIEMAIFNKEKTNDIDVEADNIYLVKAIHEIESGESVEISGPSSQYLFVEKDVMPNKGLIKIIDEQLKKLQEYNVLKNVKITEYQVGLISKNYRNDESSYIVNHLILETDNTNFVLNVENKTGKLLYIAFDKSAAFSDDKADLLENYARYLGLLVIDDWKLTFDDVYFKMVSLSAGISISLTEGDENYMLSLHVF